MEEIHKYVCLYNRYCKEYKDKYKKLNVWKVVSEKYGLEPSTAEARFKNVRTAHGRWLKTMNPRRSLSLNILRTQNRLLFSKRRSKYFALSKNNVSSSSSLFCQRS